MAVAPHPQVQDAHKIEMSAIDLDSEIDFNSALGPQVQNVSGPKVQDTHEIRSGTLMWPSLHLLSREKRHLYLHICVPLYKAAIKGDWKAAKAILGEDPKTILCASITMGYETVLHIAAGARQTQFVEKLVSWMKPEDLALQDQNGNTAFCFAAAAGAIQIAKIMMKKNRRLPTIRGGKSMTPVYIAALFGHHDMASFLYSETREILTKEDQIGLFFTCIDTGLYDLALKLLEDNSELAVARDVNENTALHVLARKPSAFDSKRPDLWKRLVNSMPGIKFAENTNMMQTQALQLLECLWKIILKGDDIEVIDLIRKPPNLLFEAAKLGNFEFLAMVIHYYPDLAWEVDDSNRSIFHIAVLHCHVNIFNLMFEIGSAKDVIATYIDTDGNNILHLAAKLPHQDKLNIVSSAVKQMQQELLWFKEVEKIVQPSFREMRNKAGQTPKELFTIERTSLLRSGELWLNNTASSCMLAAILIATTVFAKSISIPGGNNSDNGYFVPLKKNVFQVFTILYAIALSSSSTSALMFLSILILPHAENDFLKSLPLKVIVGLLALVISLITMVVAFSINFFNSMSS